MTYAEVAERVSASFIAQLEAGTVPWRKPWGSNGVLPHNYYSGHVYRGINVLITGLAGMERGFQSPAWIPLTRVKKERLWIKKGEKATHIVLWKRVTKHDPDSDKDKAFLLARLIPVFNTDQVKGIEWQVPPGDKVDVPDALKLLVQGYQDAPTITHSPQDSAFYKPSTDSITLPLMEQFTSTLGYAETICHELVHSTGHPKRCARFEVGDVGHRSDYAKEELVAEIGASMLMQHAGIDVDMPQMAAYVQSWLRALQDDRSLILKAAQAAQKAVDHILGTSFPEAGED